jgi:hypothetical protein
MNKKLAFLAAATALSAIIAVPVLGSPLASDALKSLSGEAHSDNRTMLASDDDNGGSWRIFRTGEDEEGEGSDDDDGGNRRNAANPAPSGTVAPPANGLFNTNGAKPQVQVN